MAKEKAPRLKHIAIAGNIGAGKTTLTTLLSKQFGWEPHYEQHLWVFRQNPNGAYSPFNPTVSCKHHKVPPKQA